MVLLGVVPSDWQFANVTAVFKKGKKTNPANYRSDVSALRK
jgi:hypothetical protein